MDVNLAIEQVRQAEAARREALLAADVGKLRAMTSGDYTHIESNGKSRTLDQFLEGLEHREYRFKSFIVDRDLIRIIGNAAIVTGDYHNDIITPKKLQPTKYARFIRIWRWDSDKWVNVAHQATEYVPNGSREV